MELYVQRSTKHLADRENRQTFASHSPSDNMSPSRQHRESVNPQSRPQA